MIPSHAGHPLFHVVLRLPLLLMSLVCEVCTLTSLRAGCNALKGGLRLAMHMLRALRWGGAFQLIDPGVGLRLNGAGLWLRMRLRCKVSKDIARSRWRTCRLC